MITIQQATEGDISDLAHIHMRSKQAGYSGCVDQGYLDGLAEKDFVTRWQNYLGADDAKQMLASFDGQPAGFISYGRLRTPPPGTSRIRPLYAAEIFAIYVHPDFWRKGIARALMEHAVHDLKEQKLQSLCLWMVNKNEAGKFYDALGGQRIGKRNIEIGPSKVKEICYGWRDTSVIVS